MKRVPGNHSIQIKLTLTFLLILIPLMVIMHNDKIGLVLSDIYMPEMCGLELAKRMFDAENMLLFLERLSAL